MSMWTLSIALVSAILVWFFLVRYLTARPWLASGETGYTPDIEAIDKPAKKVALYCFLAVISSLFALFVTAYVMRMDPHHGGDWSSIPKPGILWVNTLLLVLSSITMQWARFTSGRAPAKHLNLALSLGGLFTLAFLAGQLQAWDQLHASSYFQPGNPALAFFYLLTGVHGLHLLGGLYVWGRVLNRVLRGAAVEDIRLSVELCTVYWHYLLLVWLILFGLLIST